MSASRLLRGSAVAALACVAAFAILSGTIFFADLKPFDQWYSRYTPSDVSAYLNWLDADDARWASLARYRAIDMVFPAVVAVLSGAALRVLWSWGRVFQVGLIAVLVYLVSDYVENATLFRILDQDGAPYSVHLVQRAATLTQLKWASLAVVALICGVGWLRRRNA